MTDRDTDDLDATPQNCVQGSTGPRGVQPFRLTVDSNVMSPWKSPEAPSL